MHDFSKNTLLLDRYSCIFSSFSCFHILTKFWGIAHGTLEFRGCFFGDFFGFVRVSVILE